MSLLERSTMFVHLDPRKTGVSVPPWFRAQPRLVLQLGLNMPVPIRDLELDDEAIRCTLSFNRSPFYCIVPWSSVFALVGEDGQGALWHDDLPSELAEGEPSPDAAPRGESKPKAVARSAKLAPKPATARAKKSVDTPEEPESLDVRTRRLHLVGDARPEKASETPSERTPESGAPEASPPAPPVSHPPKPGGKTKREIPSYLRVIK